MIRRDGDYVAIAGAMLSSYKDRLYQLHTLLLETIAFMSEPDYRAQRYDALHSSGGTHPDPVARRFATIETLEAVVEHTLDEVAPVLQVYQSLKNSRKEDERKMFVLFERHYIDGESVREVADALGRSERTMHRLKERLMLRVCGKMREYRAKKWQKKGGLML